MIQNFKAIFFDAGGTLLHPFPSVGEIYCNVAGKHGCKIEAAQIEKAFREAWLKRDGLRSLDPQGPTSVSGLLNSDLSHLASHSSEKIERLWWRDLVEEVFASAGTFKNFEAFFEELYDVFGHPDCWRLYPGTLDLLAALKQKKKRLGIISNWDSRLLLLCKGLELEPYFDFILASAVFGASKPSPKIFEEALKRAGVAPHEAVHIGDSFEDDVKGARGIGIHSILIERHVGHRNIENVVTIHDLKELIAE